MVKIPPSVQKTHLDSPSITVSGRSPGGGYGSYSSILPGESYRQRNLADYGPQGCKESDMIEATEHAHKGSRRTES